MLAQQRLLGLLADGGVHSGNELAEVLQVSRTAVWKQIRQLEELGLEFAARPGSGYQLAAPLELLDAGQIAAQFSAATQTMIDGFELRWRLASTSDELLRSGPMAPGRVAVCMAEYQSDGRGRRGRNWYTSVGQGLSLSLAWCFPVPPANLSCLGLAVGVGVVRVLRGCGVQAAGLKWPNDILLDDRKLAGILIDVKGEAAGPLQVVIGIGLNYSPNAAADAIAREHGLAPASVTGAVAEPPGRNRLAGLMIDSVVDVLREFDTKGFGRFAEAWAKADCLRGRDIVVDTGDGVVSGVARGISPDGQLLLESGGTTHRFMTGDVRVRAA